MYLIKELSQKKNAIIINTYIYTIHTYNLI